MNTKTLLIILAVVIAVVGFKYVTEARTQNNNKDTYLTAQNSSEVINQMATVCHASYLVIDGQMESDCDQLVNEVQSRGFEVLHDSNGSFWAESKGQVR